jgi:hypothetical protein
MKSYLLRWYVLLIESFEDFKIWFQHRFWKFGHYGEGFCRCLCIDRVECFNSRCSLDQGETNSCPTNNAFPRLVNNASIPDRRVVGGGGTGTLGAIVVRIVDDAIIGFWLADGERLSSYWISHTGRKLGFKYCSFRRLASPIAVLGFVLVCV